MNKRQRRRLERKRIYQIGLTEQQKASDNFRKQIDEIRSFSKGSIV